MTDSPTRTRGGRRPGAGRPKKDRSATTIQAADIQLLISDKAPNEVETAAQRHARMAVEVLVKKLKIGVNESARITAAKAILDRGYGKPTVGGLPEDPPTSPIGAEMRAEARKFSLLAIEVLRRIAEFGSSEAASVSAAKALLDRALGTAGPSKVPVEALGKREQAVEDARGAATGMYAPPPAPGEEYKH